MGDSGSIETAAAEAGKVASDRNRVWRLVQDALAKAYRNRRWLFMVWGDLVVLCRLVAAWSSGEYRSLPWKSLVLALAGILYFLNPIDLSPDVIPGIGFLDDAGMLALVVNSIRNDLRRYLEWEAAGKPSSRAGPGPDPAAGLRGHESSCRPDRNPSHPPTAPREFHHEDRTPESGR